jgi:hypothetical protein
MPAAGSYDQTSVETPETPTPTGASVQPQYVRRVMKVYAINEHEAQTLSSLNAQATVYFSLASFFASFCLAIWINALFYTYMPPVAVIAAYVVAPCLGVIAIGSLIMAIVSLRSRRSTWRVIKDESQGVPPL